MRLSNKVAIITGAAEGIGKSCAERFAEEGASIVVADRAVEVGKQVVAEILSNGGKALFVEVDVSQPEQIEQMVSQTIRQFKKLDILVSNAGVGGRKYGDGPIHACTIEGWDKIMDINLRGTFLACKYSIPELLKTKGNIVSIASILGLVGSQSLYDTHAYMTSKAGIIGLTRTIAAYYAKDGMRANCLAPGLVDTKMAKRTKADKELLAQIGCLQPLGPIGEVQDVAEAAVFLASDEAKFITGVVLPVDGGWSAQ
jgi:NAD(P)-dependent dehydrogenase (short-subunit alcohol dehydrogenase family)